MKKWGLIILFHCIIYSVLLPWRCCSSCSTGSGSYHCSTVLWHNFPWLHNWYWEQTYFFWLSFGNIVNLSEAHAAGRLKGYSNLESVAVFSLVGPCVSWDATHPGVSWVQNLHTRPSCWLGAGKKLHAFALPLSSVLSLCCYWVLWQLTVFWILLPCTEDMQVSSVI